MIMVSLKWFLIASWIAYRFANITFHNYWVEGGIVTMLIILGAYDIFINLKRKYKKL